MKLLSWVIPVTGAAPLADARFAFPWPDGELSREMPWAVRLFPWPTIWEPWRPASLTLSQIAGIPQLTGVISRERLQQEIRRLESSPAAEAGAVLRQALAIQESPPHRLHWRVGGRPFSLDLSHPRIMGVVNVTADSFSDGGNFLAPEQAVAHGLALVAAGADLLDVGGESTRPGAQPVSVDEELQRVIPVVQTLAQQTNCPISVDTTKAAVMEAALAAGAALINDVSALRDDPAAAPLLARYECPVVLMHRQGNPATMQWAPHYADVTGEIFAFLAERIQFCQDQGIHRDRLWVDPGIGFGKRREHNLALLRHLRIFRGLASPLLLGVSRKRLVGELIGGETLPQQRDVGSHMLAALGILSGADVVRVHDVAGARQAIAVAAGWAGYSGKEDDER